MLNPEAWKSSVLRDDCSPGYAGRAWEVFSRGSSVERPAVRRQRPNMFNRYTNRIEYCW
jgi:hypothetical protein